MGFRATPQAKVNLTLAVAPRAEDGYHPLRSIFLLLGLADELTIDPAAGAGTNDRLSVAGLPGCPIEGNLVLRALDLVRREVGQPLPGLVAHLDKRIPMGAGLGGGSSDAAAALEMALSAWGIGLPATRVEELALELGSDVPFFLAGTSAALVEGRGERIVALPGVGGGAGVLLATFVEPLSTAAVFAAFDDLDVETWRAGAATDELAAALRAGIDGPALAQRVGDLREANTLWPAAVALAPEIGAARDALEGVTGRAWLMSGSGRTLFTIYATRYDASAAAEQLAGHERVPTGEMTLIATHLG